jgi:hypothetical protein
MEFAATLLLVICYGLAIYLAWAQRAPIYLIALGAGHLSALASPLWRLLYGVRFSPGLETIQTLLGQPIPLGVLLGSGWYYPLPALLVLFLFGARWWFPGRVTSLMTLLIFLLYHLLIETIGLRTRTWSYDAPPLPLGLSAPLLSALMAGLISYGLLYALLAAHRFSWQGLLVSVLPAALALSLLIYGLLGAPLWMALLLSGPPWVLSLGMLASLGLLIWVGQIITAGLSRVQPT